MSKDLPMIRTLQAFRWYCLDCDTENFDRAVEVEFSDPEEELRVMELLGITEGVDSAIVEAPRTVTCRNCLAMFRTFDFDEDKEV